MSRRAVIRRRLRSIPTIVAGLLVVSLALPLLLPAAVVIDAIRGVVRHRPWMATRMLAFIWVYLFAESIGILAAGVIWLGFGGGFGGRGRRYTAANLALQRWWSAVLFDTARRLLDLQVSVEGAGDVSPGPILVFMRHASIVDNLIPSAFIATPHRMYLRYVLKRELLADPCLDIVGNRLDNYFVARASGDSTREIRRVAELARGLGPRDGVLIYPEGTRFTAAKRTRALESMARRDPDRLDDARNLRNLLPPRLGGPLALLEAAPSADVVFCAHKGFGGFARIGDMWSGTLVGREIRIRFERIRSSSIPSGRNERADWLYERWQEIDDWITDQEVTA